MALFKIGRGKEANLPTTLTDGHAYFCTDTGNYFIDCTDENGDVSRKHINAEYANKLRFKDENEEWIEIDAKDLHDMLGFEQVQADWEQTDPTASSYILNRPFGLMPDLYSGTKTSTAVDGKTNLYQLSSGIGIDFEVGKTYELIWDGTSYSSVYRKVRFYSTANTNVEMALLGNANLLASFWTGQETVSVINDDYPSEAPFVFTNWHQLSSDGGTHTVIVRGSGDAALKKLDVKYLPDSVATQDFVIEQIENIDIDQVQVDWNENDPSAKGYILNRPFGALPNLFEATLNVTEDNIVVDGVYKADNTVNITRECVVGDTYNVFWRGAKYVCEFQQHTAHNPNGGSVGINHLGNISLFAAQYPDWTIDGEPNNLPFFIWGSTVLVNYPDHSTLVVSRDDATNFTKLDAKYLPDEAATKDFVMEQVASLDTEQVNADWNEVDSTKASYILNRPFGLIQDILGQESYEFSHANNGSTAYRCGTASQTSAVITNPIHEQLQVGEIYIVIWDNVPYECVFAKVPMTGPSNMVGTSVMLGNPTLLNRYDSRWNYEGEDNNCPFLLSLMFDIAETKGAHTVAIRAKNNFTKLDVKYLPDEAATKEYVQEALTDVDIEQVQADWGETDSSQPSYIKRKPLLSQAGRYGSFNYLTERIVGDVVVPLPETIYQFVLRQNNDGSNDYYYAAGNASSDLQQILCGQTYRVVWDENEFICVGQPMSSVGNGGLDLPGFCFLGNISIWDGMGVDEDTGEPFVVLYNPFENTRPLIGDSTIQTYSDAAEHTISITPVNDVIKLDKKYLPDGLATEKFVEDKIANIKVSGGSGSGATEIEILPETVYDGFVNGGLQFEGVAFSIEAGEQYTVIWDGAEYQCIAFSLEEGGFAVPALGNASIMAPNVFPNTEEPFCMYAIPAGMFEGSSSAMTELLTSDTTSTSHTVRIYQTKVSSVGGVSSWNDLTDKPFYEADVVVFEGEFQGTKLDSDGDGVMDIWDETMFAPYNNEDPLVVGQTYTFYWDGVAYTSECYSLMGVGCIGFNAMTGEGVDKYPVAIGADVNGLLTEGTPSWMAATANPLTDMSHSGVFPCKIVGKETKKIDDKYQHQPDWDETDVNRASFVKNKPFGVLSKAGVLYESDASYEGNDFGFMLMDFASEDVIIGGNYKVSVNGVSYTGVCEGAGSLDDGAITYTHLVRLNADGYSTLGLVCNPTLVEIGVTIPAVLAPENITGDTRWTQGEVCHIVISAMDEIVATVPHKYLDFIEKHEDVVIPKMDVEITSEGDELCAVIPTTEDEFSRFVQRNGDYVYVEFDGSIYKTKVIASNNAAVFGNAGLFGAGETTEDPFVFILGRELATTPPTYAWTIVDIQGMMDGLTPPYTRSIKVWFDEQATIKHEFLDFIETTPGTETDVLAETTLEVVNTATGPNGTVSLIGWPESLALDSTQSYFIVWDGVTYECVPTAAMDGFAIGDPYIYGESSTTNGVPFLFMFGSASGTENCLVTTDTTSTSHIVRIYRYAPGTSKIKEEYLPEIHAEPAEIPYFDLTAMGLSDIPLDGTAVGVACDTSALREAASKGLIKTTLRVADLGVTIDSICSMMYLREVDRYVYSAAGIFDSNPSIIEFIVTATAIQVRCVPLVGGTTTTMTDVSQEGA